MIDKELDLAWRVDEIFVPLGVPAVAPSPGPDPRLHWAGPGRPRLHSERWLYHRCVCGHHRMAHLGPTTACSALCACPAFARVLSGRMLGLLVAGWAAWAAAVWVLFR